MQALVMTLDNPEETTRWTQASSGDLFKLQVQAVDEARRSGCPVIVVKAHDGTTLWVFEHEASVEHPKRLESVLMWAGSDDAPLVPPPDPAKVAAILADPDAPAPEPEPEPPYCLTCAANGQPSELVPGEGATLVCTNCRGVIAI